jgi:hypothetical protein
MLNLFHQDWAKLLCQSLKQGSPHFICQAYEVSFARKNKRNFLLNI